MREAVVPVVVVGAGVSGLACARALRDAGGEVVVVDRARGVGGRCATRRFAGAPVDFGVAFLHGSDAGFLAALGEVPAQRLDGWPAEIRGTGVPCQPEAFQAGEKRLAFREGVAAFPRHLASGLDVRLQVRAVALRPASGAVEVVLESGEALRARTVVLALASEQAQALIATYPAPPASLASAAALLDMARSHACLALLAAYPSGTAAPPWHAAYPEGSRVLQLAVHDSAKRVQPARVVVVHQAHAAWSKAHLDDPAWPAELLAEAGRVLGDWAAAPEETHPHRWKYARLDRSAELAGPMLLDLGGSRLGLCGDRFAAGTGVEAAWVSGTQLATRILEDR